MVQRNVSRKVSTCTLWKRRREGGEHLPRTWSYLLIIICWEDGVKAVVHGLGKGKLPSLKFQESFSSVERGDLAQQAWEEGWGKWTAWEMASERAWLLLSAAAALVRWGGGYFQREIQRPVEAQRWFLQLRLLLGYHAPINLAKVSVI